MQLFQKNQKMSCFLIHIWGVAGNIHFLTRAWVTDCQGQADLWSLGRQLRARSCSCGGLGVGSSISTSQMEEHGHTLANPGAQQVLEGGQPAANNFQDDMMLCDVDVSDGCNNCRIETQLM